MRELKGRTALVTGASAGIGKDVAVTLAEQGMNLVLAARSADALESLAAELRQRSVRALAVPTDVAQLDQLEALVQRARAEFGMIDVLVNNAGIETYHDFHTLPIEDIVRTINVNLTAALILCRLVVPGMLERAAADRDGGWGHIVNMSSTAGKFGPAYGAAYGASKAGLVAMTESLRSEYRGRGISASVLCPGFTDDGGIYERMKKALGRGTPALMGHTNTRAVCKALVRAIRNDVPEIIVNSPPMRPIAVLCAACPRLGQWLVRRASERFLRKVAQSRRG